MRLFIDGQEFEARVQKREVIYVDLMRSGKFLARGEAVRNPLDAPNDQEGIKLAAERALRSLVPVIPQLSSFFYRFHKGREIISKYYQGKIRPIIKALDLAENELNRRIKELKREHRAASLQRPTGRLQTSRVPLQAPRYSPDFEGTAPAPPPAPAVGRVFYGPPPPPPSQFFREVVRFLAQAKQGEDRA